MSAQGQIESIRKAASRNAKCFVNPVICKKLSFHVLVRLRSPPFYMYSYPISREKGSEEKESFYEVMEQFELVRVGLTGEEKAVI